MSPVIAIHPYFLTSSHPYILTSSHLSMSDPEWASWPDEQLLKMRLCDLGVTIAGTELAQRIAQIDGELDARALTFRPHYSWCS